MKKTILPLFIFPFSLLAQDIDRDGLSDALETALAQRFAPEWRYHQKVTGDNSNQNNNELYFPASMAVFHEKVKATGKDLQITYEGKSAVVPDLNQLNDLLVPGTNLKTSDPSWSRCSDDVGLLLDFPEKLSGDPDHFPTYFRCYKAGKDSVGIAYLLFYPFDYKGKFLFGLEFGNHRGDWEGINLLISGISDFSDPASAEKGVIEQLKCSGHGPKRYLKKNSDRWCFASVTHPRIYLSWGSHTPYPQPGEWHNYKIDFPLGIANLYDDFFHGTGVVAQAWTEQHPLVNLGETHTPLVGWLNFGGLWGSDINNGNASPTGPACKSVWTHEVNGWTTWEESMQEGNYNNWWEEPFEPAATTCSVVSATNDTGTILEQVKIFPNPADRELWIQVHTAPAITARWYNAAGIFILETPLSGQMTRIDTENLSPGIYFLQIVLPDKSHTYRSLCITK